MSFQSFIKKNLSSVIYGLFGVITLTSTISLFTWSILGDRAEEVETLPAIVVSNDDVQREYLVGQSFNTEGLSLNIGSESKPKLIDISECSINADFTSAGYRRVEISYSPNENQIYQGYFDVNVFFVRNLDVITLPKEVIVNEETKTFTTDEDFKIVAELSSMPSTDVFAPYEDEGKIYIPLTEEMYTTNIVASVKIDGYYYASLYCGNLTYNFNFYNDANRTFLVKDEKDVVVFENEDETSTTTLTLVVTDRDDAYQVDCEGHTKGFYIYGNGQEKEVFDFDYELTKTQEIFNSTAVEESKDALNDLYKVNIDNTAFVSESSLWQSAVVNGLIYEDGGYKVVVNSNARILNLDYVDNDNDLTNNPTLRLYVSTFSFDTSTGSGISQGFYIYTDVNNNSFKIRFYLQTWTWDHVPLSATRGDVYSDSAVTDYLDTRYSGNLIAEVNTFVRGQGWTKSTFRASFDAWRLVAFNMA